MKINLEFQKLIPPLTYDELNLLESSCLLEGIREPILTWDGFIIDGHNRYNIAKKHNLQYKTTEKVFDNEQAVKEWMILNQFGRRNLNNYQRSMLALELEEMFKKRGKENQVRTNENRVLLKSAEQKIDTRQELAKVANVSHDTIAKVKTIQEKASPEIKEKLITGEMSINQAHKEIKKEEKEIQRKIIRETLDKQELEIKDKKYRIIYADPPWQYNNAMPEYVTTPDDYYLLMTTEDICNMPVKNIAEKNAVLFLWTTSPHLPEALEVVNAWGFEYKTTFIWDKVKHNMGHYNSVRHEILLVCVRGSCTPDVKKLHDSVVVIERTEHSKKPDYFRELIESLYIYGNKIELFAREVKDGWDKFGNQL